MTTSTWPPRSRNATLGILGIFVTGIFLTWFPVQIGVPLPAHPVDRKLVMGIWQTVCTIGIPYWWAWKRLGRPPASLGLGRANLGRSLGWGCALYVIALVAFVASSNDPLIARHPARLLPPPRALEIGTAMCLIAAGTDVATRGFVLLSLARYTHISFAIAMQNVFWLLGHTNEIRLMSSALGDWGAVGLFLLLGLLGDSIALRTRNVLGLGLAHALLNVVMISYMRWIL